MRIFIFRQAIPLCAKVRERNYIVLVGDMVFTLYSMRDEVVNLEYKS